MKRKRLPQSTKKAIYNPKAEYRIPVDKVPVTGIAVYGIHPVTHLLKDTDIPVQSVIIQEGMDSQEAMQIKVLAEKRGLIVVQKPKSTLDNMGRNHQGVMAQVKEQNFYKPLDSLKNGKLVFILDHLEDPQNLGSILRTADQFGADGVIIPKNRSVGVTSTVVKTSSGAALFMPIIQESSLLFVVERLKEFGYWIYSTSVDNGQSIHNLEFTDKVAIIVGNESDGVSEQLLKKSDFLLNIPSNKKKKVDSLNVAVATGILAYEVTKQLKK